MSSANTSTPLYYSDSSDYVSSETNDAPVNKDLWASPAECNSFKYTPFPSLTNMQKQKLEEVLHYIPKTKDIEPMEEPNENQENKNSCCCLC